MWGLCVVFVPGDPETRRLRKQDAGHVAARGRPRQNRLRFELLAERRSRRPGPMTRPHSNMEWAPIPKGATLAVCEPPVGPSPRIVRCCIRAPSVLAIDGYVVIMPGRPRDNRVAVHKRLGRKCALCDGQATVRYRRTWICDDCLNPEPSVEYLRTERERITGGWGVVSPEDWNYY